MSSSLPALCCSDILRDLLHPCHRTAARTKQGNGHARAIVLLSLHREAMLYHELDLC